MRTTNNYYQDNIFLPCQCYKRRKVASELQVRWQLLRVISFVQRGKLMVSKLNNDTNKHTDVVVFDILSLGP